MRENEELRRLLYVAATRARDWFYMAAQVDDKRQLKRGQRSVASLLPASLAAAFSAAALSETAEVEWASDDGPFAFRVCRALESPARLASNLTPPPATATPRVEELGTRGLEIRSVTSHVRSAVPSGGPASTTDCPGHPDCRDAGASSFRAAH